MASAWGSSWGTSWADSWGTTAVIVAPRRGGGIPQHELRRRRKALDEWEKKKREAEIAVELELQSIYDDIKHPEIKQARLRAALDLAIEEDDEIAIVMIAAKLRDKGRAR